MLFHLLAQRAQCLRPSSNSGTFAGGGGGGSASMLSRIHLPRLTGEVRVGLEVSIRMLACVNTPRRPSVRATRWNSSPLTLGIP